MSMFLVIFISFLFGFVVGSLLIITAKTTIKKRRDDIRRRLHQALHGFPMAEVGKTVETDVSEKPMSLRDILKANLLDD